MFEWIRKIKLNSLPVRILFCFLTVLSILAIIFVFTFSYYSRAIEKEIVTYHEALNQQTVDSFEKQFRVWRGLLLGYQFDSRIQQIAEQSYTSGKYSLDYIMMDNIIKSIQTSISQSSYYLEDLFIVFKEQHFLINKQALIDKDRFLKKYYHSANSDLEAWIFDPSPSSELSVFPNVAFQTGYNGNKTKSLLPVQINLPKSEFNIVAFIDIERLYKDQFGYITADQFVLNSSFDIIFQSNDKHPLDISLVSDSLEHSSTDWTLHEQHYYFFKKNNGNRQIYVTAIAMSDMNKTLVKLNHITLVLFILALVLAIIMSILFSKQLNAPVRDLLKQMSLEGEPQQTKPSLRSSIFEFQMINEHIQELHLNRSDIESKLANHENLLTHYHYMTRLKNISFNTNWNWPKPTGTFYIIMVQARIRHILEENVVNESMKRIYDHIHRISADLFSQPITTIQMEDTQLLSFVPDQLHGKLHSFLDDFVQVMDSEKSSILLTIAVSPIITESTQLQSVYHRLLQQTKLAKPIMEHQIFYTSDTHDMMMTDEPMILSLEDDRLISEYILMGNISLSQQTISKLFDEINESVSTTAQLVELSDYVIRKYKKALKQLKVEFPNSLIRFKLYLQECVTIEHYKMLILSILDDVLQLINEKRAGAQDIINTVLSYIENHYQDDISLDYIASKLNMSAGYLSLYIKENTGTNFIDHLNGIRLKHAKHMLQSNNLSIQEVGMKVGYRNVTSFIRMFKKETGTTPGDFRKKTAYPLV
ncbi:helix-turn-helix domain-containing protein [Paenibacillus spongiae]|uniref:Helix-turn-helix domain-containing protein n=1 Tax=Paenibacillus spongiae TaxID=2909671 RepID=A0ABY5S964_9BACL|nr:helix-turn-helix domain-containing protein [Paenibacillus spongiae]UVI30259.1 helix-turn-helix domain-containing protein [Paenibacillus spongiae]